MVERAWSEPLVERAWSEPLVERAWSSARAHLAARQPLDTAPLAEAAVPRAHVRRAVDLLLTATPMPRAVRPPASVLAPRAVRINLDEVLALAPRLAALPLAAP